MHRLLANSPACNVHLAFPLLSDFADRHVATAYGILVAETMGAAEACGRLAHRAAAIK